MYIITATFDPAQAQANIAEVLALGHSPERLAERLGIPHDLDVVKEGILATSFKRLPEEIVRLRRLLDLQSQIDRLKADKSMLRFLGSGFKEKQTIKLEEERRTLGPLLDSPRWFYSHPRVRLLSAIRDYGLDGSQQGNAVWIEVEESALAFAVAAIFENADLSGAETLARELEKPLSAIAPLFVLTNFEGNRSISFDLEHGTTLYYAPTSTLPA